MAIYQRIGEGFGDGAFFVGVLTEKKLFRYCIVLFEAKRRGLLNNRKRILREGMLSFFVCSLSFPK